MSKNYLGQQLAIRLSSFAAFALLGVVSLTSSTANVQAVLYGNKLGTNVDYLGVQEQSATDPGLGLFGNPTITGDSLDFNPQGFAATSTGLASDTTDSNLQFAIQAKPGKAINNVQFTEAGDTTLTGLAGDAQTTVANTLFIEITQYSQNNVLTNSNLAVPVSSLIFSPKSLFKLSVDGSGTKSWNGAVTVNLGPVLTANGINNGFATRVFVSLDNTLTAASVAGTSAFIQKKDADGLVVTVNIPIPEPATFGTAIMSVVMCGGFLRRRS